MRLAVGLISAAVIILELGLMRGMSLRFWSHFAHMVISVALLGFGVSGTVLTIIRRPVVRSPRAWVCGLALGFAAALPVCLRAAARVDVDAQFLAWDPSQLAGAAKLELLLLAPFLLAASAIGAALTDRPDRLGGHYAANLLGSGLGGAAAVALMHFLDVDALLLVPAAMAYLAALILLPWRRAAAVAGAAILGLGGAAFAFLLPPRSAISPYKMLPQVLAMPDSRTIHRASGPLGRIDVVEGPAIHYAPGLSLQYTDPIPPQVLLITDGDGTSPVYDCRSRQDWAFLDYTTAAAAYHLRPRPATLIIGAGGGADIGLAVFHHSPRTAALEMNRQVIDAMTGPLAGRGGAIYHAPGVTVTEGEARGYLAAAQETFDVIQLPAIDAFGASGAGLVATQEAYLYTVEAIEAMLRRLSDRGVLCITRWARTPPRDGLRVFDTAAAALRKTGRDPASRLAMIRCWATVTVLAFSSPLTDDDGRALREFCRGRSFDLCYLPDMTADEANRYHILDRPYYHEGARALLGPARGQYLDQYLFDVAATTDDRPYFFRFFRWRSLPAMVEQLGQRSRAMLEMGYLMLLAALAQAVVLAAVLILLPLAPGLRALKGVGGKVPTLAYFLLLGAGFMLLEMAFLQKLILYLAHPVYSAAVAIGAFLIFAGLGSRLSQRFTAPAHRLAPAAAGLVVGIALLHLLAMDAVLGATQGVALGVRAAIAASLIAPLAVAMGHMFPVGLRQVGQVQPALVPWAWGVNGFASVIATVGAGVLAMQVGFARLTLVAVACYALAGLLALRLPQSIQPPPKRRSPS